MKGHTMKEPKWWEEDGGLFGEHYMECDNSQEGFMIGKKMTLEQRTAMETDGLISLLKLEPGMRVLDLPCGYGRHSNALASEGLNVVGGDVNSLFLSRATADAKERGLTTDFRKINMLNMDFDNEFDAAINMFFSFGFFETDDENFKVLKDFYRSLKIGGKFLMHTDTNVSRIIENNNISEDNIRTSISGNKLHNFEKYNPETKRVDGFWRIIQPNGAEKTIDYSVRVYTSEEFTDLCHQAGFRNIKSYSDWDGTEFDPNSQVMIVVAEK